ncbi:hypothetical protein Dimus_021187 [Dionaea muscipula]
MGTQMTKFCLMSRQEHYSISGNGNSLYSTKAQFCDTGIAHEILIQCVAVAIGGTGNKGGLKQQQPVLSISIDKRRVVAGGESQDDDATDSQGGASQS